MAESISIRERVERVVLAKVQAISGITSAARWDMAGDPTAHLSASVYFADESAEEGSAEYTKITLPIVVALLIAHGRADTDGSMKIHNRWLSKIKAALLADPYLIETATNTPLATDVRYTGADAPHTSRGQAEFFVIASFEAIYDEARADPYTAPGVTLATE